MNNTKLIIEVETLRTLLAHATSAARIIGHLGDAIAVDHLADHVDAIAHELTEILGDPHLIPAPVLSVRRSAFALNVTPDAAPERMAPDEPAASHAISIAIVLSGGTTGGAA